MQQIVDDILDAAVLDSGARNLQREVLGIGDLVREVAASFADTAAQKGMELEVEVDPETPAVVADRRACREIAENLISNALKFTSAGGHVEVAVAPVAHPRSGVPAVRLRVRDDGPGIADAELARMFGRFQRLSARPTAGEPSTGLGLYIVKRLVDAHGGVIEVEGGLGEGATFQVVLPAAAPEGS